MVILEAPDEILHSLLNQPRRLGINVTWCSHGAVLDVPSGSADLLTRQNGDDASLTCRQNHY